jgi:serine protease Do
MAPLHAMKKTLGIIVLGLMSGFAGSFLYHRTMLPAETPDPAVTMAQESSAQERGPQLTSLRSQRGEAGLPAGTGIINEEFVEASRLSAPSVVYIKTISQKTYASSWMDWFFSDRTAQSISSGSGVVYSPDGYIITNNHVVGDADQIQVILDKRSYQASLIGTDPSTDLAVLKIEAANLPAMRFGSSRNVRVGEWVLAVGNPFNLTSTVTAGIVSAKGRELNILQSSFPIESFIQTDAPINPGNSGGALVNTRGELVGINTAILSRTGSYAGYGFAVPADIVRKVTDDLIRYGEVQKAFFGAEVMDIDYEIAGKLGLSDYSGVVVSFVQKDGAAGAAGIEKGDIILKINNNLVNSRSDFEEMLSYQSPGDRISVEYRKGQRVQQKTLTLTNREGTTERLKREIFSSRSLGADFEKVSKVERDLLNIPHGVRIAKVRSGLIAQMGLNEGFIVTAINQIPIRDPESLSDILSKIRGRITLEGVNKNGRQEIYRYYF